MSKQVFVGYRLIRDNLFSGTVVYLSMNWRILKSESQLEDIKSLSKDTPVVIFKHSTTCPISSMAKSRLTGSWDISEDEIIPFYLDLLSYRSLSSQIADTFDVVHESPQVLLIKDGACIYENSHLDINTPEIKEALNHKVI